MKPRIQNKGEYFERHINFKVVIDNRNRTTIVAEGYSPTLIIPTTSIEEPAASKMIGDALIPFIIDFIEGIPS